MRVTKPIRILGERAIISLVMCFVLACVSEAAGPPPIITVQPANQTVIKGDNATFGVQARSVTLLSYQWMGNGKKISGATNSNYIVYKAKSDGVYAVIVANAAGSVTSSSALLTVISVPVPPVGNPDSYTMLENSTLRPGAPGVLANDISLNGNVLTAQLETTAAHGALSLNSDGSFTYTPAAQFNGKETFAYRPTDGISTGNVTTVTINVAAVNDPPVARDDMTNTVADTGVAINVLANDTDPEGTALTVTGVSATTGTVVNFGTNVLYTPPANFSGKVTFTYTISDGLNQASANVTVSVLPRANPDMYRLDMNSTLSVSAPGVLGNDSGSASEALQALLAQNASNGSVLLKPDGSFTYTPNSNYFGTDSFTYEAFNSSVTGAVTTVSLGVRDTTPLRFVSAASTPQGFALQIVGPQVPNYVILFSTNLLDWTPIATNSVTTGAVQYTDAVAKTRPMGFFRAFAP